MSSTNSSRKVVSVDEQAFEQADEQAVDEDGFPVVDETPEFEATVEEETQAKVDANHPDGIADTSEDRIHGVTLEQEEHIEAREAELEHISAQAELGTQDGREQRTHEVVTATQLADDFTRALLATVLRPEFGLGTDALQLSLPRLNAFFLFEGLPE